MRLALRGRHVSITPALREHTESRLAKLAGHLPAGVPVEVELSEETRSRHIAEATVFTKGSRLRARVSGASLTAAIDRLAENLERQAIRYREKRRDEPRRHAATHDE